MLQELYPLRTGDYLRPSLWRRRLVIGHLALDLTVQRQENVEERSARVGNRIQALRIEQRLSQMGLANALHVSAQTIDHMERGTYTPSLALAFRVSQFFDLAIEDIFSYL